MNYVDSSVVLADLLAEQRSPPAEFWNEPMVASRLLEYETWTKINALGLGRTRGDRASAILDHITMVGLSSAALGRALEPFPIAVRTLEALHLATIEHLRSLGHDIELASYDARLIAAARALGIPIFRL